jgi:hypothetical protein
VKRIFGGWHRPVLAVAAAAAAGSSMFVSAPAYAAQTMGAKIATVRLTYATPEVVNRHIIWRWTLTNTGPGQATNVRVVHNLDPRAIVTSFSTPCTVLAAAVRCTYALLTPGAVLSGVIGTDLPAGLLGPVQINGQAAWEQPTSPVCTCNARSSAVLG